MAIEVISEIVPKNHGQFPIADINNIRGGLHSVTTIEERNSIPQLKLKDGMLIFVKNDTQHWYQYSDNKWIPFTLALSQTSNGFYIVQNISELNNDIYKKPGLILYVESNSTLYIYTENKWKSFGYNDSIPIYTQSVINDKGTSLPDKYISVPDKISDLNQQSKDQTFKLSKDSSYVDILTSSIRALQMEVAKIKNTFKYGMYSYTGTHTAMSTISEEIQNPEKEPLWAVDENTLSEISELPLDETNGLKGIGSVNTSIPNKLQITGEVTWQDELFSTIKDEQIFIYITSSNNNIKIVGGVENDLYELDLSTIINSNEPQNIMICINRPTTTNGKLSGKAYIYIVSDNYYTDKNIIKGYYSVRDNTLSSSFVDLTDIYIQQQDNFNLNSIIFKDIDITKAKVYSKYQTFSNNIVPSKPNDSEYKYNVAHITIRSIDTYDNLVAIQNQLPENELIFVENTKRLYIKNHYKLQIIGGSSTSPIQPPEEGMTEEEVLAKLKDLGIVTLDNGNLELSNLQDIIFVNNDTGKKFKMYIDAYGKVVTEEVTDNTLAKEISDKEYTFTQDIRGFIGQLRYQEHNSNKDLIQFAKTNNLGLYSDRLQIAAMYCPLTIDTIYGCTHSYIELQNTSDTDFQLEGCYLHIARKVLVNSSEQIEVQHLALDGFIPAGGTYLIRGKKWANPEDSNVFINVSTYDKEWYVNGELFNWQSYKDGGIGIALTYGNANLSYDTLLVNNNQDNATSKNAPYIYDPSFIDGIYCGTAFTNTSNQGYWAASLAIPLLSNSICKNTFELEPAQQGFQGLNKYDSSRNRWSSSNDYANIQLDNEYIEFPFSDEKYPVSLFTPKASFEYKNVCTDKTKLDLNKPNAVVVSFGKNIYTTRCFNWVSSGLFDEYVFIKYGNTWKAFESYKEGDTYDISTYPQKVQFDSTVQSIIYNRFMIRFPANNTLCTSHKCIIKFAKFAALSPTTYTYIVGRALKNGQPDFNHCSEERTFTLYPESYVPRIYQITDQQGFHWIEYQVWAAAAKKVNERILEDSTKEHIIPILIDTGDVTQNGTRVNEWLDYFIGGDCLFNHLEQMNIVGNNDLCSTIPTELGTGDDIGKSNSYYFHIFNCYEIDTNNLPIVNNKYVPSLYYFETTNQRFVMVNSEITYENCTNWFNLKTPKGTTVNIYTGWSIPKDSSAQEYFTSDTFTPLYDKIFNMTNTTKKLIVCCHESPFTVITNNSLANSQKGVSRSISNTGTLVGSHLNQICPEDNKKGIYWFSRLMEYRNVGIVLCGHKHTYTCTYPLREYYFYDTFNSKDNGPMPMNPTLQNDNITFIKDGIDYSKLPLTKRPVSGSDTTSSFLPYTSKEDLTGGITYFMCQATGYKLTSNKELPSANQKFSKVLPQTTVKNGKDSPSAEQKYPMFAIISLDSNNIAIKLLRIKNIFNSKFVFNQQTHSTTSPVIEYLGDISDTNNFGVWGTTEKTLVTL